MSRPIKIQSYGWGTGTNLFEKFNPWSDFFENPRVINRISNFNLMRCKLCVKFVLNGNGFHYGRAIASYIPLHTDDTFTVDRSFFIQDVVAASQRPHIYLDPTKSQGGTICLPFVWPYNALDIPDQEWDQMGAMVIHGMQNLKHANGATDSVTVSVFAWAEDVQLAVPTANEPSALAEQAGEYVPQADEYGQGIISKPANLIARAAGALTSVPSIAPYARATEIGAGIVAKFAAAFGYSRPVIASDIVEFKPVYVGNMANANTVDTSTKLTLDLKQELTCDTRTMGLDGTDEMTIKSIATRESFLTNFGWQVADTAEDLLWNSYVNPVIWSERGTEYHMPACCFAALPFKYWRGTMKFRFQIVASSFHKGRLKITYDPSYPATNEYNTNFTRIIDLAEERDFTVEIGWGQQQAFLQHLPMLNGTGEIFSSTALGADRGVNANGIISVYVVNELTVPNSTANNDIEVNVFVSMGDDFEVAVPDNRELLNLSWFDIPAEEQAGEYVPQSGESPDGDNTEMESAPMSMSAEETMAAINLPEKDHTFSVFFGDPVTSIRQLSKRYTFSKAHVPDATPSGEAVYVQWSLNNIPLHRGYAPGGVNTTDVPNADTDYNYCNNTFFNYYAPAYVCWRGGSRWKYNMINDNNGLRSYLAVDNDVSSDLGYTQSQIAMSPDAGSLSTKTAFYRDFPRLTDGGVVVPPTVNPTVEVEIPYYSNKRFSFAKQANVNLNPGTDADFHDLYAVGRVRTGTNWGMSILAYHAMGEDFTLGFYVGPPIAYYVPDPTPAT